MFKFELGDTLVSVIHGFEGVAVSRSEHITGCRQYLVQPPVGKDGKPVDAYWLDEGGLKQKPKIKRLELPADQPRGGPGKIVTARGSRLR